MSFYTVLFYISGVKLYITVYHSNKCFIEKLYTLNTYTCTCISKQTTQRYKGLCRKNIVLNLQIHILLLSPFYAHLGKIVMKNHYKLNYILITNRFEIHF